MTEQEALNTRCCGPDGCGVVGNPDYENGPCSRWCIASACMAWRWHSEPTETCEFYTTGKKPDGDGWRCTLSEAGREGFSVKSRWERDVPRRGHCGLAGKP